MEGVEVAVEVLAVLVTIFLVAEEMVVALRVFSFAW